MSECSCGKPATRRVAWACVHEHGDQRTECDSCAGELRTLAEGYGFCALCMSADEDWHDCPIVIVSDNPIGATA